MTGTHRTTWRTWRKELTEACEENRERFEDLTTTLTESELDTEFHAGYGAFEGAPFTAWSKEWVYFPGGYDGGEWVACVPRNPCDFKTRHVGGGG